MNAGIMAELQIPMTVIVKATMAGAVMNNADTAVIRIAAICMQAAVLPAAILFSSFVKEIVTMVILAMHIMYVSNFLVICSVVLGLKRFLTCINNKKTPGVICSSKIGQIKTGALSRCY